MTDREVFAERVRPAVKPVRRFARASITEWVLMISAIVLTVAWIVLLAALFVVVTAP